MPRIPATCPRCGLLFPSGISVGLGAIVQGNKQNCPRCGDMADVFSGYTTLINGLVAFVASPSHSFSEKQVLFQTASDVSAGKVDVNDAVRSLEKRSPEGGQLLREWLVLGLSLVATMASVGSFLLSYYENKGNAPLEEIATQVFEEVICTTPQPDKRKNPAANQSTPKQKIEDRKNTATRPKAPNENRKARRTRLKKERSKSKKR